MAVKHYSSPWIMAFPFVLFTDWGVAAKSCDWWLSLWRNKAHVAEGWGRLVSVPQQLLLVSCRYSSYRELYKRRCHHHPHCTLGDGSDRSQSNSLIPSSQNNRPSKIAGSCQPVWHKPILRSCLLLWMVKCFISGKRHSFAHRWRSLVHWGFWCCKLKA